MGILYLEQVRSFSVLYVVLLHMECSHYEDDAAPPVRVLVHETGNFKVEYQSTECWNVTKNKKQISTESAQLCKTSLTDGRQVCLNILAVAKKHIKSKEQNALVCLFFTNM